MNFVAELGSCYLSFEIGTLLALVSFSSATFNQLTIRSLTQWSNKLHRRYLLVFKLERACDEGSSKVYSTYIVASHI